MRSDEGRDDCQQLKPKGSHAFFVATVIAVTILLMLSILFSRVAVNELVFVLRVVFYVTRYMYDARRWGFALSASFVSELECFDGNEVRGKGNDSIVQKQNCVVAEIKEVELRSRRHGKFIYNRTYNSVGLNKVSQFFRRGRGNSRLPMKKI